MKKIILCLSLMATGQAYSSELSSELFTYPESSSDQTPITQAINDNDTATLAKLLKMGSNPDQPNAIGQLPLTLAARKPDGLPLVELLLKNGANPNITEVNSGNTPLLRAISALKNTSLETDRDGIYNNIEKLILSGARVNIKSTKTGLAAGDLIPKRGYDRIFDKLRTLIESLAAASIVQALDIEAEKARENLAKLHASELEAQRQAKAGRLGKFLGRIK